MSTRIDGNKNTALPAQIERTEAQRAAERGEKQALKPAAQTDRVELSKDAAFVNEAVHAANHAPAIRTDKVEQAKKALADGTLGTDADALADAIIDRMLDDTK